MGPCILYKTFTAVCLHEEDKFMKIVLGTIGTAVAKHLTHAYGIMAERVSKD
jgi:uncharacterized membrane protein YeaQ/YmgE (transglycosylase-associated protein family)